VKHHRLTRCAALGLTLAALGAPTAIAQQDLRSPDARDAARTSSLAETSKPSQDLRSPDTRDAAEGRGTFNAPKVTVVKVWEPSAANGGLDWGDIGIGAGGTLGLTLVGVGSALAVVHRRQHVAARQSATTG
jgi:hypothetical protein